MKDWHAILDISENASLDQIKSAYRKKALEYHPDRIQHKDASKFIEINEAYRVLTNPSYKLPVNKPSVPKTPVKDAPSPKRDIWGKPVRPHDHFNDSMRGQYWDNTPKLHRRQMSFYREPEVDIWKQMKTDPMVAYWKEYERLKREMIYEEPELFWKRLDEWQQKHMPLR